MIRGFSYKAIYYKAIILCTDLPRRRPCHLQRILVAPACVCVSHEEGLGLGLGLMELGLMRYVCDARR
jgi:hypothetical protein